MKALLYKAFGAAPTVEDVPDPSPGPKAALIRVEATGLCRSDWHGWMGHDRGIRLPHVPGHEFAGVVESVGASVTGWRAGDRVTAPFVCACGSCGECRSGNQQVCERQVQPGFSYWGSFAERVVVEHADVNLVHLPDAIDFTTAASLGCRFSTAFRAVVSQGRAAPGEWVVVHGCGGVGLSAVMIATAVGARVVAVDVSPDALALARDLGAMCTIEAGTTARVASAVRAATDGGAHLSLDALGSVTTCGDSVRSLRARGRHVQVGLMLGDDARPVVPMARVVAMELEILGSHGMAAHEFVPLLALVAAGRLRPDRLVQRRVSLAEAGAALTAMTAFTAHGLTVVTPIP